MGTTFRAFADRVGKLPRFLQAALFLLVTFAVCGVVLGAVLFATNVRRPIAEQFAAANKEFETTSQREAQEVERSKTRDTDGDGLMDYDEKEVFRTSPFLRDSDSDGVDDKTEVYAQQDPNCPANTICTNSPTSSSEAATPTGAGLVPTAPQDPGLLQYLDSLPIEQLYQLLEQAGVSRASYENLSEAQLRELFRETIINALSSPQATTPSSTATSP